MRRYGQRQQARGRGEVLRAVLGDAGLHELAVLLEAIGEARDLFVERVALADRGGKVGGVVGVVEPLERGEDRLVLRLELRVRAAQRRAGDLVQRIVRHDDVALDLRLHDLVVQRRDPVVAGREARRDGKRFDGVVEPRCGEQRLRQPDLHRGQPRARVHVGRVELERELVRDRRVGIVAAPQRDVALLVALSDDPRGDGRRAAARAPSGSAVHASTSATARTTRATVILRAANDLQPKRCTPRRGTG